MRRRAGQGQEDVIEAGVWTPDGATVMRAGLELVEQGAQRIHVAVAGDRQGEGVVVADAPGKAGRRRSSSSTSLRCSEMCRRAPGA